MSENFYSVYVHVPFCQRKCNYCAFNSEVGDAEKISAYVDALTQEIKNRADGELIGTIYFGGGTPSILRLGQLEKILDAITKKFSVIPQAEITLEINPGTVDKNFLKSLRNLGFNRVSIGVQSFSDKLLKILGRIHDSETAAATVNSAKNFFDNVSLDLMYGLPEQTLDDVDRDINFSAALNPEHISVYGLEIEEGTKFYKLNAEGKLPLPDENFSAEMYDLITEKIPATGYNRYEISNFAKIGFESRHNIGYWTGRKYFGFGAGAHSFDGKLRTSVLRNPSEYIKKISARENVSEIEEILSPKLAMEEFCFLGLRMTGGIDSKIFSEKFGADFFEVYGKIIDKHVRLNLINISGRKIFLTSRGMKLGNLVLADFLLD